ncbi:protein kinase [Streptomyces sp. NBRC 110028]|uniref:protein kinase n=1 Tax=Streptomyces sp. NBRC 110028 TaxID=1621260 RepID=UPI0006E1B797|nr:protein kinase [Streptomyces sp. NBRC 110028]
MDEYAGRVLADRYRLPLPPADEYEFVETRAFDTYSGQQVHLRQIPLPEVVDAEVVDDDGHPGAGPNGASGAARGGGDPAVRRALDAATAAAQVPDHPRLGQVFHVFAEAGSLWIVSELVAGRPLAALLTERNLSPHRAAEVANDVLTALRALHAHGWTHRNITTRTVLLCDDGRAMLTGLAAGAAEEALCGYDPVPRPPDEDTAGPASPPAAPGPVPGPASPPDARAADDGYTPTPPAGTPIAGAPTPALPHGYESAAPDQRPGGERPEGWPEPRPGAHGPVYRDQGAPGGFPAPRGAGGGAQGPGAHGYPEPAGPAAEWAAGGSGRIPAQGAGDDPPGAGDDAQGATARAARAKAIAAYAAGARAAAARAGADAPRSPAQEPGPLTGGAPWPDSVSRSVSGSVSGSGSPSPEGATVPRQPSGGDGGGSWDGGGTTDGGPPRGPTTALAAERARQARIVVVGAVTERWAPEQAGPVHENWRLAPPVGPAADLWALGVLLFRAVQGHAPYPEENAAELVQMVCAEAPAYAEECGPLRPVVESLMRQDPTERPDFEELRGWLRSLIRSAPEPDVGSSTVTVPSIGPGGASDPKRLPIVRRRGWLVRRGRGRPDRSTAAHGRHKRAKQAAREAAPAPRREQATGRKPRRLGRVLLLLILLGLAAAVLYAMMFMPRADNSGGQGRTGSAGAGSPAPTSAHDPASPSGEGSEDDGSADPGSDEPQSTEPAGLAKGFAVRKDPKGFSVAVHEGWTRRGENARGQIRYIGGDIELVIVAGRDKVSEFGGDPMAYQQNREAELAAFRDSAWASSSGLKRIDVGKTAMAEGQFSWRDSSGRNVYARNLAMLIGGRYHVVLAIGPADERRTVNRHFEQATATYSTTG